MQLKKITDLSHIIDDNISVFPGSLLPVIKQTSSVIVDGFSEMSISMNSHTGTHVDAPSHMIHKAPSLDHYHIRDFIGKAKVIDCSYLEPHSEIPASAVIQYEAELRNLDFVLFYTGWSKKWGTQDYVTGFPVMSRDCVAFMCEQNLKGIGIDCVSIDNIDSLDYPTHKLILKKSMVIIENLNDLASLIGKEFLIACFPLNIPNADASPVRAVGIEYNCT